MKVIDHRALGALAARIFAAGGSAEEEARLVADHLVEANLCGHDSHGVGMIPRYVRNLRAGSLVPNRRGRVLRDEGAVIVYDGERGYGQVVARAATELAIRRASASAIAAVALRNAHHIGRVGAYGEQCAAAGMLSVHFVNVTGHHPLVAPHRGRDARLATNPVCIAVPAAEPGRPIILDMATSKVAMGKVRVARNRGAALPPGLVLDAAGAPSTDPRVMFEEPTGAILPFAEHKGYALAFICELLAGAIGGGGTLRPENQAQDTITNAMLSFVLDPASLVDRAWLRDEIAAITAYVTASPPRRAEDPVLIPGDPERLARAERMRDGIALDEATWGEIVAAARSLGLDLTEAGVTA